MVRRRKKVKKPIPLKDKFADLPDKYRKTVLHIIRDFLSQGMFYEVTRSMGLEKTEESVIHLLELGLLRLIYIPETPKTPTHQETISIQMWDCVENEYRLVSKK